MTTANKVRIGILGASGYTGAELLRLLALHPGVEIRLLTADRQAGKPLAEIFPHLGGLDLPGLVKIEEADWSKVDFVFCCLPHGTTQEVIASLPRALKIVDLSADFRLADLESYATWYGHAHRAPDAAGGGRLWPDGAGARRGDAGAAGGQSRLLSHLRPAAADPAARSRRDRRATTSSSTPSPG